MSRRPTWLQASFSPSITLGCSINPNCRINREIPAPTGTSLTRWSGMIRGASELTMLISSTRSCRTRLCPQVMCQREWDPGACCAEARSRSGPPDRWVCQDPFDEIALSLTQSGAVLFEEQVPRSPGQHQKCDEPCQQQREPAAFQELRSVGGDKYQIDDEEEAVDGGYD